MATTDFFGNVGTAAAGTVFGSVKGGIGAAIGYKYSKKMAKLNYKLNEMAAENADARRRALYGDFESPAATIRQLKEAGLSPSLYAAGDLGGTIGATAGAQGAGGSGQAFGAVDTSITDMGTLQVQQAQARLMNAEADKLEGKNAEGAANIDKLQAETEKALAGAGLDKANTAYTDALTILKKIESDIADATKDVSIWKIKSDANAAADNATKAFWDAQSANLKYKFDLETFNTQKEILAKQVVEIAALAAMEQSQYRLNEEERTHIKDFAQAAIDNAKAHGEYAKNYGNYIEFLPEKLNKELEIRGKELNVEKWRIGVDAVTGVVKGGLFALGTSMFGNGAQEITKEFYAPSGASKGYSKTTKTSGRK